VIESSGRSAEQILQQTEEWIEAEVERISDPAQRGRIGMVRESDKIQ
jgi:hypothetical protein